jgi:uncharacterized protein YlzI (FlbEa/FlbD family)
VEQNPDSATNLMNSSGLVVTASVGLILPRAILSGKRVIFMWEKKFPGG